MDTDDDESLEDIIERYDEDQKKEKIEQTDQRSVNQKTYRDFAEKYKKSFLGQFPEDVRDKLSPSQKYMVDRMEKDVNESLEDMNNIAKNNEDIDKLIPVIPMGKNTQPENKSGFSAGKGTKTTITPASKKLLDSNPLVKIQHEGVRKAWNALPDEQRDLIGEFQIRATSKSGTYTGGTYDHSKKKLTVTLHARNTNMKDVFNDLHHELGHAQYHKLMETSPDKIKKFNETVKEAQQTGAITTYAGSFRQAEVKARERKIMIMADIDGHIANSIKYPKSFEAMPDGYRDKAEKNLTINIEHAKTIYENETHSAIAQVVSGTNTSKIRIEDKETLRSLFNAYKELHE